MSQDLATARPYRPLPEGPSPRWKTAASGLRVMVLALLVQTGASALAMLASSWAQLQLLNREVSLSNAGQGFMVANGFSLVAGLAGIASAVGLGLFSRAPVRTGVPEPARAALWVFGANLLLGLLGRFSFVFLVPGSAPSAIGLLSGALTLVHVGLTAAFLLLLFKALRHAGEALAQPLPGWAAALITGTIVWRLLSVGRPIALMFSIRVMPALAWALVLVGIALDVALALGLARLLGGVSHLLARQEEPASTAG